jgi:hypothetical protein
MNGPLELWSRDTSEVRLGMGAQVTFHLIGGWMQWLLHKTAATPPEPDINSRAGPPSERRTENGRNAADPLLPHHVPSYTRATPASAGGSAP